MVKANKLHLIKALKKDVRYDGRKKLEYRPITVETGVYKNAEGSARVKIGDTEVMAGVKMDVQEPYPDQQDKGTIMVGVELTPLASPKFELGPPRIEAIELARVVDRGIRESEMIDLKSLCVKEGELVWIAIIDIVPLNDDGNLYDAASLAAIAAIKDAKMPKLDGKKVNYDERTKQSLKLNTEPISVTVLKIGDDFIVDPTTKEWGMMDARLTVAVSKEGNLHAFQKGEASTLSTDDIAKMIDIAKDKSKELRKALGK